MSEIDVIRTPDIIAAEINGIKAQAKTVVLCMSIEIGRRLVEAKSLLDHGEWGPWLERSVDYSQRTAQNLMRIFEEYGADQLPLFGDNSKAQAFANLSYTQAIALLGVPAEDREAFAVDNDVANMSTRELQEVIKQRDEFQLKYENAKSKIREAGDENELLRDETTKLRAELNDEQRKAKEESERLAQLLAEARKAGASAEKVAELQTALNEAQRKIQSLTDQLAQPVTMEAAVVEKVVEKIPEEIERELEELRKKVQNSDKPPAASGPMLKFEVHFDNLVSGFKNLLSTLAEIKEADPDAHGKYKNAVTGLIGKMTDRLAS